MTLVPSRPPVPDSEAHGLTGPPQDSPAARVRALAHRILETCTLPTPDNPAHGLIAQGIALNEAFIYLLLDFDRHGLTELRGINLAMRAQKQCLDAFSLNKKIEKRK